MVSLLHISRILQIIKIVTFTKRITVFCLNVLHEAFDLKPTLSFCEATLLEFPLTYCSHLLLSFSGRVRSRDGTR